MARKARSRRWLAAASLGVVAAAAVAAAAFALLRTQPTNVLLISMDTLRAGHLSCYGYDKPTSPNIDAVAARGTRFAEAFSTSAWTSPAHATLFTSRYPTQLGIVRYRQLRTVDKLRPSELTLAEVLKKHGYDTAAFTGGGFVSSSLGFSQGFESYRNAPAGKQILVDYVGLVQRWIEGRTSESKPFFLFLHFYDCHRPYDPPIAWAKRFVPNPNGDLYEQQLCGGPPPSKEAIAQQVGLYDGQIGYADHVLRRVFDTLDKTGLRDHTLVVFLSDHGEEFRDHGGCDHIHSVYDELVHIPLVFEGPHVPKGKVVHAPVSMLDVAPTILHLLGVHVPARMEGQNLVPAMHGKRPKRRYEFFETGFPPDSTVRRGVRDARTKLIFDARNHAIEMYDLSKDPKEQKNVLLDPAFEARRMRLARAYQQWRASMHRPPPPKGGTARTTANHRINPQLLKRLRALGYTR